MNSRKEFKQYFTPPRIADFIIEFLLKIVPELKGNKLSVIDPSCGEGVFLEKAHSYGLCNAEQCFGVDLDPRLAKDWQNRGFLEEGLRLNQGDGLLLEEGKYDVALGNPPFGLLYLEKAEPAYRSMELVMRTSTGVPPALRDVPQEMMFLEKFVKLLKPGGVFAIILPVGIFKNITMKYIRDWVRKKCRLLAVVNLQKRVFSQTGAAAYTSILFARKIEAQPEDRIIFAQASNIDLKQEEHDDLDKILEGVNKKNIYNENLLLFDLKEKKLENFRWDPDYYNPIYAKFHVKLRQTGFPLVKLNEILGQEQVISGYKGKQQKAHTDDKISYITSASITASGLNFDCEHRSVDRHSQSDPRRSRIQEDDILLVRSGEGCIGRVYVAGPEDAGNNIRSEIYILRPDPARINPYYLAVFRNSFKLPFGRRKNRHKSHFQICRLAAGVGTPNLNKLEILSMEIPVIDPEKQKEIENNYRKIREQKNDLGILSKELEKLFQQAVYNRVIRSGLLASQ